MDAKVCCKLESFVNEGVPFHHILVPPFLPMIYQVRFALLGLVFKASSSNMFQISPPYNSDSLSLPYLSTWEAFLIAPTLWNLPLI